MKKFLDGDNNIIRGWACIIIAILVIIYSLSSFVQNHDYIINQKAPNIESFTDNKKEPKKDTIVEADIKFILDWYVTETIEKDYSKSETNYCIALLDNGSIISVTVDSENYQLHKQIDALIDQTWDYNDGKTSNEPESIHIIGSIQKLPDEAKSYYDQSLIGYGIEADNGYTDIYHFTIDTKLGDAYEPIFFIISGILVVAAILFALLFFHLAKKSKNANNALGISQYNNTNFKRTPFNNLYDTANVINNISDANSSDTSNVIKEKDDTVLSIPFSNYEDK